MTHYKATVSSVDGETSWEVSTTSFEEVERFLKLFDHEGSSISLHILGSGIMSTFHGEEVYTQLTEMDPDW